MVEQNIFFCVQPKDKKRSMLKINDKNICKDIEIYETQEAILTIKIKSGEIMDHV